MLISLLLGRQGPDAERCAMLLDVLEVEPDWRIYRRGRENGWVAAHMQARGERMDEMYRRGEGERLDEMYRRGEGERMDAWRICRREEREGMGGAYAGEGEIMDEMYRRGRENGWVAHMQAREREWMDGAYEGEGENG
jgi:hypothetical protein